MLGHSGDLAVDEVRGRETRAQHGSRKSSSGYYLPRPFRLSGLVVQNPPPSFQENGHPIAGRMTRHYTGGDPLRTFFAFDPRRSAILLIGGNKTGDKRFYDRMIPIADDLYGDYLQELKEEGLI